MKNDAATPNLFIRLRKKVGHTEGALCPSFLSPKNKKPNKILQLDGTKPPRPQAQLHAARKKRESVHFRRV